MNRSWMKLPEQLVALPGLAGLCAKINYIYLLCAVILLRNTRICILLKLNFLRW